MGKTIIKIISYIKKSLLEDMMRMPNIGIAWFRFVLIVLSRPPKPPPGQRGNDYDEIRKRNADALDVFASEHQPNVFSALSLILSILSLLFVLWKK